MPDFRKCGRRYDAEFKANAVALVQSGRTVREIAHDLVSSWLEPRCERCHAFGQQTNLVHRMKTFCSATSLACGKKGLDLCFYYSHGRDLRHPHAPNNDEWGSDARPAYNPPDPAYAYGQDHHLQRYVDFMTSQITELLTHYGPVAAIWLDGIATPKSRPAKIGEFHCQELYDRIHRLQPQVLVSYKQGLLGTEDFFAPEQKAVKNPSGKPMEICSTLQEGSWGYHEHRRHITTDEAWAKLAAAGASNANLLLNTGPMPDGSICPPAVQVLHELGERIRKQGFPTASESSEPAKAPIQRKRKNG